MIWYLSTSWYDFVGGNPCLRDCREVDFDVCVDKFRKSSFNSQRSRRVLSSRFEKLKRNFLALDHLHSLLPTGFEISYRGSLISTSLIIRLAMIDYLRILSNSSCELLTLSVKSFESLLNHLNCRDTCVSGLIKQLDKSLFQCNVFP